MKESEGFGDWRAVWKRLREIRVWDLGISEKEDEEASMVDGCRKKKGL